MAEGLPANRHVGKRRFPQIFRSRPGSPHDSCYSTGVIQRDFFSFCTSLRLIELKAIGALSQVRHFARKRARLSAGTKATNSSSSTAARSNWSRKMPARASATTVLSRGDIFGETARCMGCRAIIPPAPAPRSACNAFAAHDFPELMRGCLRSFFFLSEKLASRLFQARELARSPNNSLELTGSLANFDVVTIYQTIIQSMQTGLLTIADEDGETISTFYFEKGRRAGAASSISAARRLSGSSFSTSIAPAPSPSPTKPRSGPIGAKAAR